MTTPSGSTPQPEQPQQNPWQQAQQQPAPAASPAWQASAYQQSGAGPAPVAPRQRSKAKIFTGIGCMVLALLATAGLLWWAIGSNVNLLKDAQDVPSGQTVHLEAGKSMTMWVETTTKADLGGVYCELDGPSKPEMKTVEGNHSLSHNEKTWTRAFEVTAHETGDYSMTCTGASKVKVTTTDAASDSGKALGLGILGAILLGGLLGFIGLVLLILGLVGKRRTPPAGAVTYQH